MLTKAEKALWIEALRSGKYEQGVGGLARDNKFCCLGIACEVLGPLKGVKKSKVFIIAFGGDEILYNNNSTLLPQMLVDVIGISHAGSTEQGAIIAGGAYRQLAINHGSLSAMNDNGVSFEVIAQFLEDSLQTSD